MLCHVKRHGRHDVTLDGTLRHEKRYGCRFRGFFVNIRDGLFPGPGVYLYVMRTLRMWTRPKSFWYELFGETLLFVTK